MFFLFSSCLLPLKCVKVFKSLVSICWMFFFSSSVLTSHFPRTTKRKKFTCLKTVNVEVDEKNRDKSNLNETTFGVRDGGTLSDPSYHYACKHSHLRPAFDAEIGIKKFVRI